MTRLTLMGYETLSREDRVALKHAVDEARRARIVLSSRIERRMQVQFGVVFTDGRAEVSAVGRRVLPDTPDSIRHRKKYYRRRYGPEWEERYEQRRRYNEDVDARSNGSAKPVSKSLKAGGGN